MTRHRPTSTLGGWVRIADPIRQARGAALRDGVERDGMATTGRPYPAEPFLGSASGGRWDTRLNDLRRRLEE